VELVEKLLVDVRATRRRVARVEIGAALIGERTEHLAGVTDAVGRARALHTAVVEGDALIPRVDRAVVEVYRVDVAVVDGVLELADDVHPDIHVDSRLLDGVFARGEGIVRRKVGVLDVARRRRRRISGEGASKGGQYVCIHPVRCAVEAIVLGCEGVRAARAVICIRKHFRGDRRRRAKSLERAAALGYSEGHRCCNVGPNSETCSGTAPHIRLICGLEAAFVAGVSRESIGCVVRELHHVCVGTRGRVTGHQFTSRDATVVGRAGDGRALGVVGGEGGGERRVHLAMRSVGVHGLSVRV